MVEGNEERFWLEPGSVLTLGSKGIGRDELGVGFWSEKNEGVVSDLSYGSLLLKNKKKTVTELYNK